MSPEPEKEAAAPRSETAAAVPAQAPFSGGKSSGKVLGSSGPGEPYTPMPDFSGRGRPWWKYALTVILVALAASACILYLRGPAAAPASQPAHIAAPAVPGQGN